MFWVTTLSLLCCCVGYLQRQRTHTALSTKVLLGSLFLWQKLVMGLRELNSFDVLICPLCNGAIMMSFMMSHQNSTECSLFLLVGGRGDDGCAAEMWMVILEALRPNHKACLH